MVTRYHKRKLQCLQESWHEPRVPVLTREIHNPSFGWKPSLHFRRIGESGPFDTKGKRGRRCLPGRDAELSVCLWCLEGTGLFLQSLKKYLNRW